MTSLLKQLQADQLNARKARDSIKATLLTTVLGEAVKVGKDDGDRDPTDTEVMDVFKKFVKNIKQNIIDYGKAGNTDAITVMDNELSTNMGRGVLIVSKSLRVTIGFISSTKTENNVTKRKKAKTK